MLALTVGQCWPHLVANADTVYLLQAAASRRPGGDRLDLEGGHQLFVFRDVRLEGLAAGQDGLVVQVRRGWGPGGAGEEGRGAWLSCCPFCKLPQSVTLSSALTHLVTSLLLHAYIPVSSSYLQVSFEPPPLPTGGTHSTPLEWWRHSKRLSMGTLLCFWWEPQQAQPGQRQNRVHPQPQQGQQLPDPRLVVGVVAQRDPKDLAGWGSTRPGRSVLGIR